MSGGIAVRAEIPRTTIAAVPVVPVAFSPLGEGPVRSRAAVGKAVALPVLSIGKPGAVVGALTLALVGNSLGVGLWRNARLRLKPLLRLLIRRRYAL